MNTNTENSEFVHHSWVSKLNDSIQELIEEKNRLAQNEGVKYQRPHGGRPLTYDGIYMAIEAGINVPLLIRCGEHEIHSIRQSIYRTLGAGVCSTKVRRHRHINLMTIMPTKRRLGVEE